MLMINWYIHSCLSDNLNPCNPDYNSTLNDNLPNNKFLCNYKTDHCKQDHLTVVLFHQLI